MHPKIWYLVLDHQLYMKYIVLFVIVPVTISPKHVIGSLTNIIVKGIYVYKYT